MNELIIENEFKRIELHLLDRSNWQLMQLTRAWAKSQPKAAGVYMLFENEKPIYVGESGSLSGRITDMLDSRHHTVRRALGEKRFYHIEGFRKATSSIKHPAHIELMVHEMLSSFSLSVLPIQIGRKEFEEYIFSKYQPELNRKSKRGSVKA